MYSLANNPNTEIMIGVVNESGIENEREKERMEGGTGEVGVVKDNYVWLCVFPGMCLCMCVLLCG